MAIIVRGEIIGGEALLDKLGVSEGGHAFSRCINRVERAAEGKRGKVLSSEGHSVVVSFEDMESACLSSVEMHKRVADLPPISGIHVSLSVAIMADPEEQRAIERAARLLTRAIPGQILCDRGMFMEAARQAGLKTLDLQHTWQPTEDDAPIELMDILWNESRTPDSAVDTVVQAGAMFTPEEDLEKPANAMTHPRLRLCYGDKKMLLDDQATVVTLGRDRNNDMVIADSMVSRVHARIVLRERSFRLEDMSTNGTYVSLNGSHEVFVHHNSLHLHGHGVLCMGLSVHDKKANCLEFELF
ncbi:MAG: FHA domain-containing protein [Zoogloeaceae bacterium]|jgi:hypothetical protein|nr:FHA domain-containing protein [Zoogloeaceae bacterium]